MLIKVKWVARALDQLQFLTQILCQVANRLVKVWVIQPLDDSLLLDRMSLPGGVEDGLVLCNLIDPLELFAHANGPVYRGTLNIENCLDLIQQLNRIANITIHLVDEGENGGGA